MRHASRALSLLLAFLLVLSTLSAPSRPALASAPDLMPLEGFTPKFLDTLLDVTLDNFKVGVMDNEPAEIGISARILVGADGERYLASGELTGAIGKAFSYVMCFEDGAYHVRMQNLSSDYTLSEAALDACDPEERPIDYPLVPPVLPRDLLALLDAVQRMSAIQNADYVKTPSYELTAFRELGLDKPGSTKRVNVLGENMDLMFFEAALDAKAMDDLDAAMRKADQGLSAAQADIDRIMAKYTGGGTTPKPGKAPESTQVPEASVPSEADGYVNRGEQVDAKYRLWSDETSSNTRSERDILSTSGEGDKRVERRLSSVWEQRVSATSSLQKSRYVDAGKYDTLTVDEHSEFCDDGGVTRYTGERDGTSHYENGDIKMDAKSHSATSYSIHPDGTHKIRIEGSNMMSRQKADMLIEVEGGPAEDGALLSHISLSIKMSEQDKDGGDDRQTFALSAGFDMRARQTPMPEGTLKQLLGLQDGAAALELSKLTDDQKAALQTEINTAMIVTSGTMMATPGVAKLMADVQSAMDKMVQDMLDQYVVEDLPSDL